MDRCKFLACAFAALPFLILTGTAPVTAQDLEQRQRKAEEEQWGTRQPTFTELDTNGDGYLSREEAAQWHTLKKEFDTADTNNDERIDRAEFRDFETKQIEKTLLRFKGAEE